MDVTVDASVVMAVILNEPAKQGLLERTRGAELFSAPSLPWEVGNALSAMFKRRRLNLEQAKGAEVDIEAAVTLAERHDVYAYDAYLIECARRYQTPLLSLDRRQCEVARKEGVEVMEVEG